MEQIKKTRNRKMKYPYYYNISLSNEELNKIKNYKLNHNQPISKIIRDHLLIGGLMEDDQDIVNKIKILRKSEEFIYKNQIGFKYTEKMEQKLKELEEKTGAYKTSLIRTFLQNSKLI